MTPAMMKNRKTFEPKVYACQKKAFFSKSDAEKELLKIIREGDPRRRERAFYDCPVCFKWHLTSQQQYERGRPAPMYR